MELKPALTTDCGEHLIFDRVWMQFSVLQRRLGAAIRKEGLP